MRRSISLSLFVFVVIIAGCQHTSTLKTSGINDIPSSEPVVRSSNKSVLNNDSTLAGQSNAQEPELSSDDNLFKQNSEPPSGSSQILTELSRPVNSDTDLSEELLSESATRTTENEPLLAQEKAVDDKQIGTQITSEQADDSDIDAQGRIDQALELCNEAQQMWEKGKIEEALANLDSAYYAILGIDAQDTPQFNQQKEDIRYLISKRVLEIYASRQIVLNGHHNEIPIPLNDYVKKEIKRLTGRERKFFVQSLERSQKFRPFIVQELKKAGLPEEISWLPLIESGFKIRALSKARALGLWQFIPSTGYKFGLNRNYYIDERLDPEKATLAAIAYLKELHNLFGDWTTALAAYNCGEARVLRIIRKQKINYLDNFWDLFQNLPRETSRYVPRFLATLHIIQNLDQYNIDFDQSIQPVQYQTCKIKKQVRLKDIAKEINYSAKALKDLNPELRYGILPAETYQLKIPTEKADLFLAKIDRIKATYSPPPMYVYHRVRRGETLSGIARKYKTSIRAISTANHINRRYTIIAGQTLKIPSRNGYAAKRTASVRKVAPGKTIPYTVRRGDNLWHIARKFGTTTKTIKAVNKLSSNRLSIGQRLYITSRYSSATSFVKSSGARGSTYQVQSGDSPFLIAKKYNMDLNRFLALNQLSKNCKIFPGQSVIIE